MEHFVQVTTTGSAGSASGTATTPSVLRGFIEAIQVDYHASAPASTTVAIAESGSVARTVLTLATQNTDVIKYPSVQACDASGSAVAGVYTRLYVPGLPLTVTVTGCNALTNAVTVRILVSEF